MFTIGTKTIIAGKVSKGAWAWGYRTVIDNPEFRGEEGTETITNPQTEAEFLEEILITETKRRYQKRKSNEGANEGRLEAIASPDYTF